MGNETKTIVRYDGEPHEAKVLLETEEVIVRGGLKLRLPFRDIRAATPDGSDLILRWSEHELRVPLGRDAVKWAEKIRNPKSRIDKLGVKRDQKIAAVGPLPGDFLAELEASGADISRRPRKGSDIIFTAINSREELPALKKLRDTLQPAGAIWVIRPKGDPRISESDVMDGGKSAGLVDVKVARFSASHTAEKFVIPIARR
ncbi:MAG: hypothetical protein ACXVH7_11410 [Thermoanaerobaculia bacterium]